MIEDDEKVGLKLNIQKTEIMASGPITSWEIDGETVEPDRSLTAPGARRGRGAGGRAPRGGGGGGRRTKGSQGGRRAHCPVPPVQLIC